MGNGEWGGEGVEPGGYLAEGVQDETGQNSSVNNSLLSRQMLNSL
jgi:hypothetical protein